MGETHKTQIIALCRGRTGADHPSAAQRTMLVLSLWVDSAHIRLPKVVTKLSNWPLPHVEVQERERTATVYLGQVDSADPKPEIRRGFHNLSKFWLPVGQATQACNIAMLPKLGETPSESLVPCRIGSEQPDTHKEFKHDAADSPDISWLAKV